MGAVLIMKVATYQHDVLPILSASVKIKKNTYPVGSLGCRVRLGVMLPPVHMFALEIDSFSKILVKIALCWLP